MSKRDYYMSIDIIVHRLISVADSMIHSNPCANKDNCEIIKKSRQQLYCIREDVLALLNEEEE